MLAHATGPYTASEERRETTMGRCHPLDPTIALQDYATRSRSFDFPRHESVVKNVSPTNDETFGQTNTYTMGVPQKQFHKSHSSAHRLVHPCMPVSNQATMNNHYGDFDQNLNVRPHTHQPFNSTPVYAASNLTHQQRSIRPNQEEEVLVYEDIESGLASSSSSGRSSASSLVRGAGESVLAGIDWAGNKLANLFGISQHKYHWAMTEHENVYKQGKGEFELDRLAKSTQFFNRRFGASKGN